MNGLLFSFCMIFGPVCYGDWVELQRAEIEFKSFTESSRDPLISNNGLGNNLDKELNLDVDIDLFDVFFWNNTIHSQTDTRGTGPAGQFRLIGWKFETGLRIHENFEVFFGHESRHTLDYRSPWAFPLEDYFGFRLKLFDRNNGNRRNRSLIR